MKDIKRTYECGANIKQLLCEAGEELNVENVKTNDHPRCERFIFLVLCRIFILTLLGILL